VKQVMCGDGPERVDAEALAVRLGVADSVEFVGKQPQSQVREYLSVADLLLLPSQSESFGLTALEAMACEVPVIATRVGGIPELVEDGGCGYLFEIGDVDGMARAAVRILGDESERERLGSRGREIAVSQFATEKIIPQYEDLYRRVTSAV
jgi:glycosyltransferase involved in cell wall biosynthesis